MRHLITTAALVTILSTAGWASAQELTPEEQRLVELVNAARAQTGLAPLSPDPQLTVVARGHSMDMAQNNFFSHVSPTSGDMGDRLRTSGVAFGRAAENIAIDPTINGAHEAFMNSPHHRANVLDADYTHVGIGIVQSGDRFVVTQAFMRPRGEASATEESSAQTEDSSTPAAQPSACPLRRSAPEAPTGPSPRADTAPPPLMSPFDLLGLITGTPQAQEAPQAPSEPEAESNGEEAPATPQTEGSQPTPTPGLWIVREDGSWHRVDVNPDALIQLLTNR